MKLAKEKYTIHDLTIVGEGKYSIVYQLNEKQVIKVIKEKYSTNPSFNKLQQEIYFYQQLENIDFIPIMYDYGLDYIVLEFINGYNLLDLLFLKEKITKNHLSEIDRMLEKLSNLNIYHNDTHFENVIYLNNKLYLIDLGNASHKKFNTKWIIIKKIFPIYYYFFYPLRFIFINRYTKVLYLYVKHKVANPLLKKILKIKKIKFLKSRKRKE